MQWKAGAGVLAAGSMALLAACGGGGGGSGASTAAAGDGTLRMALTDAPACGYDHVWVTVERVRVHQSGAAADEDAGWREIVLDAPRRIDLLALTNGVLEELGQTTLPAGRYSQVRLVLAANGGATPTANAVQPTGGGVVALRTPSGSQSGLKLQAGFEVQAGQSTDLVLDFDACRSIVVAGNSGQYNLKPVLSLLPRVATGIQGWVDTALPPGSTTVSAQRNGEVVRATAPDATGRFVLPFLEAGSYDVVVAAEGRSTAVVASVPVTATVTSVNGTATAILPPPSAMREIRGTVSVAGTGTATATVAADARIRALQAIGATPAVEVAQANADAALGGYRLRVPTAAPVRSPWAAGGTLAFAPDAAAAATYRVQALATGRTPVEQRADVGTADALVDLRFPAAP